MDNYEKLRLYLDTATGGTWLSHAEYDRPTAATLIFGKGMTSKMLVVTYEILEDLPHEKLVAIFERHAALEKLKYLSSDQVMVFKSPGVFVLQDRVSK